MAGAGPALDAFEGVDFDIDLATGALRSTTRLNALLGYADARPLGRDDFYARVHPDDAPSLLSIAGAAAAGEANFEREFRVVLPDGTVRWIHARGQVDREGAAPRRIRGACFEITHRKRSEEAARESEQRYRALTQASPSAILVSCGGRYVYANDAAARLLRAGSARELVGRTPYELAPLEYHELLRLRISQVLEQRGAVPRVRFRWLRLDGGEVDVDAAAAWVPWEGEDAVQIVAHDITEEVLIDEALRESRALLADELEDATRLQDISRRLIEADDAGAIYRELLKEAVRLVHADGGSVQRLERPGGAVRVIAWEGFDRASLPVPARGDPVGDIIRRQALEEGRRILVEDVEHCEPIAGAWELELYRRQGMRAVQATPLIARDGAAVGLLSTHWNRPHRPPDRVLRLLDVLARQAADLLERHRAQERLAAIERRQSFLLYLSDELRRMGDADEVRRHGCRLLGEYLGADRVHYAEPDERSGAVAIAADWHRAGLSSQAGPYRASAFDGTPMGSRGGQPLAIDDTLASSALSESARVTCHTLGIGAFIVVPLKRGDRVLGSLSVLSNVAREWTADEVALGEEVADRVWARAERARTDRALKESRAVLQAFYDGSPLMMGVAEVHGDTITAVEANQATARFFGVDAGALGGRHSADFNLSRAADAVWLAHYRRALYTQRPVRFEYEHETPDGPRWIAAVVVCLGIDASARARFSFVADDITERKRVEAMARESEARRALLLSLDEALQPLSHVADVEREGCRVVRRLLGADRVLFAEAVADERFAVTAVDAGAQTGPGPAHVLLAEYSAEKARDLRAGRTAVCEGVHGRAAGVGARLAEVVTTADVPLARDDALAALMSAHRRAPAAWSGPELDLLEEAAARIWAAAERARGYAALCESEQRFRTLLENLRDYAIYMLDANGFVTEWSDGAARVKGYAAAEVLGRHVSMFYTPEDIDARTPQRELEEAERVGRAERDGLRVCRGGKRIWVNEISTEVRGPDGVLRGFTRISRDITERRRAEGALADAARHKDEFLAMLSHELRNPLAPIRNSVYLLRHVRGESEAAQHAQGIIERQVQHLTRLVDDLLDVTRIARGKIELRLDRVELRELVRRAGDDFGAVFRDRDIGFHVALPDAIACCAGDATRLNQAVGNLLANAAKFTRAGDQVALSLAVANGEAAIRVRDTGLGIEPDLLPHLFDPFVQGARAPARSEGGLGLGLALVKGITELHGGHVAVASAGKGTGSEFTLFIPLAPAQALRCEPEPAAADDGRRRRVLVVDDNADAAESLAAIIQLRGHDVEIAYDGPGALARVRSFQPDVVLCDIGLPGMSGYEVAQALRAEAEFGGRLIAVSGYAQPDDVRRGVEAGFDGHLAKPFDPQALERLLA